MDTPLGAMAVLTDSYAQAVAQGQREERERIRTGVTGLPLDNSGRVDYADLLAVIDGGEK